MDDKLARFKVKDPSGFKVSEATQAVNDAGGGFKATVARTGSAIKTP